MKKIKVGNLVSQIPFNYFLIAIQETHHLIYHIYSQINEINSKLDLLINDEGNKNKIRRKKPRKYGDRNP
jgi:hypothetical protein